jgi:hypothetical protein
MEECVVMNGTISGGFQFAFIEECDCCGDRFGMSDLTLEDTQLLCQKCRKA